MADRGTRLAYRALVAVSILAIGAAAGGPARPGFASGSAVSGLAWDWGYNGQGTLGATTAEQCSDPFSHQLEACSTTPIQVTGIADAIALDGGGSHSLALRSDG